MFIFLLLYLRSYKNISIFIKQVIISQFKSLVIRLVFSNFPYYLRDEKHRKKLIIFVEISPVEIFHFFYFHSRRLFFAEIIFNIFPRSCCFRVSRGDFPMRGKVVNRFLKYPSECSVESSREKKSHWTLLFTYCHRCRSDCLPLCYQHFNYFFFFSSLFFSLFMIHTREFLCWRNFFPYQLQKGFFSRFLHHTKKIS